MSAKFPVFPSIKSFDDVKKALDNIRSYFSQSRATSGRILRADSNGIPVNALNTDDQVNKAVLHQETEDVLSGIVLVDGQGHYTAGTLVTGESGNVLSTTKSVHVTINGVAVKLAVVA